MGLVATALSIAAVSAAAPADADAPYGAVGGVRDPASGVLELTVQATDSGSGLLRASASLDGRELDEARFDGGAAGSAGLQVPTTQVPDGTHQLRIEVEDAAGNVAALVDRPIAVVNAPVQQTTVVQVTVGSAGPAAPAAAAGCAQPQLTVLRAGRTSRIRGTLRCGRRPAPRGTLVEVFGGTALKVRAGGRLGYRAARAVVFRARGAGGEVVAVRVPRAN